jgi:predicted DNA-binding transcriptional regulator AlpA
MNKDKFFNNQIWRINDVAAALGVSKGYIYNLVCKSKKTRKTIIPHHKKGKLLFFIPDEILSWIQEGDHHGQ